MSPDDPNAPVALPTGATTAEDPSREPRPGPAIPGDAEPSGLRGLPGMVEPARVAGRAGDGVAVASGSPSRPAGEDVAGGAAPRAPRRATFAARFAAIVLDVIVLALAQVALAWTARAAVATAARMGTPLAAAAEIAEVLAATGAFVLPAVYFTVLHAGEGRTLGKHAMHLRVARPDGRPIGLGRSLLRWIGYEVSAIPLGLGFAMALGPRRRALHDLLADTVVLDSGPGERA